MAKLDLNEHFQFQLELVLYKVTAEVYHYELIITCRGINVFSHWQNLAYPDRPSVKDGLLYLPTAVPFDERFRPLLTEEWPIKLTDWEGEYWMTVIAWPSAFLPALEMRSYYDWEYAWEDLALCIADRREDERNKANGQAAPKKFYMEREEQLKKVRFSFQFAMAMNAPTGPHKTSDGMGHMAFDAYVNYDALERFLNELEAERKALQVQGE